MCVFITLSIKKNEIYLSTDHVKNKSGFKLFVNRYDFKLS